ncbi:MAG: ribosome-associated translation inhibitor RaiA [Longimonas sp.]|uniref:ribosome hibernation-promoting factor, HPF/YfiA family n=1 Tax=Longimonas sp. TaxID=2039626 RepID=UPI003975BBB9
MNLQLTTRHVTVSPQVQSRVEERLQKLERYYDGIINAEVILSKNNSPAEEKTVEARLDVYQKRLTATGEASNHEDAAKDCVDQLRRQLEKYKAQLRRKDKDAHR